MDKITPKRLEIKHTGEALACGTLQVFLGLVGPSTTIYLAPLVIRSTTGTQQVYTFLVHLTARNPGSSSPVLFASFCAAEVWGDTNLVFPCRVRGRGDITPYARQLQQEFLTSMKRILDASTSVYKVVYPARYMLPEAWLHGSASTMTEITFREGHWIQTEGTTA